MTSFFNNSIHQLVAVEQHCKFSMKNGRENRNNGNQEKGKEEKETLSKFSTKSKRGREMRPLSFFGAVSGFEFRVSKYKVLPCGTTRAASVLSLVGLRGRDFGAVRNALLFLGAQTPIRAEVAVYAGLRIEDAVRNALRSGFDPIARGDQV